MKVVVSSDGTDSIRRYTNTTLKLNTWYHVTGVYNATAQTLDVYVNGVLDNGTLSGTVPSSQFNSSNNLQIGAFNASGLFRGTIDDVRIYNRALSAQEVKRLYNMGR